MGSESANQSATSRTWACGAHRFETGRFPLLMGIVNVTPDSFSDGGCFIETDQAVRHGLQLVEDGADLLDVGGESTRPGADSVPLEQELRRVIPVIERLSKLGAGAFAGEVNLHEHEALIEQFSRTYAELRMEFQTRTRGD